MDRDKSELDASVLVGIAKFGQRQDLLSHVIICTLILHRVSENRNEVIRPGHLFLNLTEVGYRLGATDHRGDLVVHILPL